MAYSSALNSVYNHYLTTYAPKSISRYDTHKKSELRNVYSSIVKLNKESPLSIIDTTPAAQQYAVSIKESARELHNTIASLGGLDENALLSKRAAYSTATDLADAKYIGDSLETGVNSSFELGVKQLAQPQINTGKFLDADTLELDNNTYSFDIAISDLNYEFQFNVREDDTNGSLQSKLAKLINNSNIGLTADVLADDNGQTALQLTSNRTGSINSGQNTFTVSDEHTSKERGAVAYLGLDQISTLPTNAVFTLNGEEHSAYSNTFTVEKSFEITLNNISVDETDTTLIGTKTDIDSLTENVTELVHGYNDFLRTASEYLSSQPKASHLVDEVHRLSGFYQNELDALGLSVERDGTITIDPQLLSDSAGEENARELFSSVRQFTGSLLNKTNQVSLNPMNYVQKTVVAYKNPDKNFSTPYITSQYSGMMFNGYC